MNRPVLKFFLGFCLLLTTSILTAQMEATFNGVTLPVPSGWAITYTENVDPPVSLLSPDKKSTIAVTSRPFSGVLDVDAQKIELIQSLSKSMSAIEIDSSGKDFIEYHAVISNAKYNFYQKHLIVGERLFIFTYTSPADYYLLTRQTFLELVNNFRTINQLN